MQLHDVADADDPDQFFAVFHRQVADAPLRHEIHDLFDAVSGRAGNDAMACRYGSA